MNPIIVCIALLSLGDVGARAEMPAPAVVALTKRSDDFLTIRTLGERIAEPAAARMPALLDDYEAEDTDSPDIWDILIWVGAWIGRVTKTILIGIVKLSYALYTGMAYGWESVKSEEY